MIAEAPTQDYQQLRPYLFSVAYRLTGSASDAEDLVHDAWIRYLDAERPKVDSLRAWLTTTVSRLALDYLKSARVRREHYTGMWQPEPVMTAEAVGGPEEAVEQREAVSLAFLTLLEQLGPEQRVVYVLREGFAMSYGEIAAHLDKSVANCRQIFRRAQQRLNGRVRPSVGPDGEHAALAERFLLAISTGDAAQVAVLLTEDVVWISDSGGKRLSVQRPIVSVDKVSRGWAGLARKLPQDGRYVFEPAHINGAPAIVVREFGVLDRVMAFDVFDGRIAAIRVLMNPDKLRHLERRLGGQGSHDIAT
ncbi:MAG TPA: RNA polymerase sigma factor SigJ [Thermomicrobiales bacterium]|nr:RNA polymerase sigma factor SigJ [Thermomicrobiales bacterium]